MNKRKTGKWLAEQLGVSTTTRPSNIEHDSKSLSVNINDLLIENNNVESHDV